MAHVKQRISGKVFSVLLAFTLIATMLPVGMLTAFAAVQSAPINIADPNTDASGTNWTYEAASKTLYLNGVNINSGADDTIKVPGGTIIETIGLNTLKTSSDWSTINGLGDLTIQGSGVLDVECSDDTGWGDAIYAEGSLTIKSGYIKAYMSDKDSSTAVASYGPMFIEGGYLDTSANKSMGGITSNDEDTGIVISGGYVKAHGDGATGTKVTYGISSGSIIFVEGGYLEATSGNAKNNTAAIMPSGGFVNTGGVVKATSGYSSDWNSYGISAGSYASFDGGVTIAKAGGAEGELAAVKTGSTIYPLSSGELAKDGSNLSALEVASAGSHFFTTVGGTYPATDVVVAKHHNSTMIPSLSTNLDGHYVKVSGSTAVNVVANISVLGGSYVEGDTGLHAITNKISGAGTLVGVGSAYEGVSTRGIASTGTIIGISNSGSGVLDELFGGFTGTGDVIGISQSGAGIDAYWGGISGGNFIGISNSNAAIRCSNPGWSISGGHVTAYTTAANTNAGQSPLYFTSPATISGGSVTAVGNRPSSDPQAIIYGNDDLIISGGKVYAHNVGTGSAIKSATSLTAPGISLAGLASSASYGDALTNAAIGATTQAVEVGGAVTHLAFLGGPALAPASHTVTFNPNGGTVTPASVSVEHGETLGLLPTPTLTGYTFGGWFTDNTTFANEFTFLTQVLDDTPLFAKWTRDKHSVTYDANGGTGTVVDTSSPYSDEADVTVLANSFTNTGLVFTGWNTAQNGSGTTYQKDDIFVMGSNAVVLYAQWGTPPPVPTPASSTWSLAALAFLALVGAGVVSARRKTLLG